jgi:benzoylformate decarboxylase
MAKSGIEAMLDVLAAAGVRTLFGNPGTTELPLMDRLASDDRFRFVLGLHEIAVMAMADGYAQASGQVGFVNLHTACGLGNAMGMLFNAQATGVPLIVTAGQQDARLRFQEPVLTGEMVAVARPWVKWAAELTRPQDLPDAIRRAIQIALTPPMGPVFLSLPLDVQQGDVGDADCSSPTLPDQRVRPPAEALAKAADWLLAARSPAILAGTRAAQSGAHAALVALAERLGAPVHVECSTSHGRLPFPCDHPLYAGRLPLWSPEVRERLAPYDRLFLVGVDVLREYLPHEPARAIPESCRLVHLDSDPWQIGKNYPVELALLGDPRTGLEELDRLLTGRLTPTQAGQAARRITEAVRQQEIRRSRWDEQAAASTTAPLPPAAVCAAIARALPTNAAVIEEAPTTTGGLLERYGVPRDPLALFGHRGWALGWGLGAALGVKLAWPDRPVLAVVGDGASLYGIQALWNAARDRLPVTVLVCNNTQYRILKVCGDVMKLPAMTAGRHVGMDLTDPLIDYQAMAAAYGVASERVATAEGLTEALTRSLAGDEPRLIEVAVE